MRSKIIVMVLTAFSAASLQAQQLQKFNLKELLQQHRLTTFGQPVGPLSDKDKAAITSTKIVWLKDVDFSNGVIECDIRGRDVLQRSFLGIAFHGVDTTTYDAIYFRPFNFRSPDSVRRIHAVQYISHPQYPWHVLREQHPGQYEKAIIPPPLPAEWFHARIELKAMK